MKKGITFFVTVLLLAAMLVTGVAAIYIPPDQPSYVGTAQITSTLTISSAGRASCNGTVSLRSGYTADVTVRLKQDGVTIKTWTASGDDEVSAGGHYYVDSNHNYVVTTTATVYTSGGSYVEAPSKNSDTVSY